MPIVRLRGAQGSIVSLQAAVPGHKTPLCMRAASHRQVNGALFHWGEVGTAVVSILLAGRAAMVPGQREDRCTCGSAERTVCMVSASGVLVSPVGARNS